MEKNKLTDEEEKYLNEEFWGVHDGAFADTELIDVFVDDVDASLSYDQHIADLLAKVYEQGQRGEPLDVNTIVKNLNKILNHK